MKFTLVTPKIIKYNEPLKFNVIDYYTLLNKLKDIKGIIIHDKITLNTLRNYLFNLDSIQNELLKYCENSLHVSLLNLHTEVVYNHIIFLTSYIKAVLCNKGYINENNEKTWGFDPIKRITYIEELLSNAFEWLDFVQYSKRTAEIIIFQKYSEVLSLSAFDYYSLSNLEDKAKESLYFSIKKFNSQKCIETLNNYDSSLKSIKFCKSEIEKIDNKK